MFSSNQSNVAAVAANYIEDVFSTYLYTGNGATQTITNNIDLSTKGGLVWAKDRSSAFSGNLTDTTRGAYYGLTSSNDNGQYLNGTDVTAFNSNGFSLGYINGNTNVNGDSIVSWTFRKQPKFFDIQSWSGDATNRTIAHSLGVIPGCIIVKRTDIDGYAWAVYHRSLANTQYLTLNTTAAAATGATRWNSTTPTSAVFSLGTDASVNASGGTYIAYLFAHDAGGFGLAGTDNVISCGSLTGSGAGVATTVTLGYEPQFIIAKRTDAAQNWIMFDNMRGLDNTNAAQLFPNLSNAESVSSASGYFTPTATGFKYGPDNYMGDTANIIYIAIRRGPMKVPTLGTSVFKPVTYSGNGVDNDQTTNFPVDLGFVTSTSDATGFFAVDRLRGPDQWPLNTWTTGAESTLTGYIGLDSNTKFRIINNGIGRLNSAVRTYVLEAFQRAPSFFDEVCYTGTGSATTFSHNLTVVPELMFVRSRNTAGNWTVYVSSLGNNYRLVLNDTGAAAGPNATFWNNTTPTSSVFTVGTSTDVNYSGFTFVAYLFATCPGVSKVGSYTGNGTTQTIDCGFGAGGARFVMIKRTDSAGDFYVYDTARGMTVVTDPYLTFNGNAANTATLGSVTTVSTGFAVDNSILAGINAASPAAYIFLAIA